MTPELLAKAKSLGFSDRQIAHLSGQTEDEIRAWCDANFTPVFPVPVPIEFDAWFASLRPSKLRRSSC